MRLLLKFADAVDALSEWIGQWLKWLVLFSSLISAGNALVRYTLHTSSNAWLEIQWYMFGAMFLLGGGLCPQARGARARRRVLQPDVAATRRRGSMCSAASSS